MRRRLRLLTQELDRPEHKDEAECDEEDVAAGGLVEEDEHEHGKPDGGPTQQATVSVDPRPDRTRAQRPTDTAAPQTREHAAQRRADLHRPRGGPRQVCAEGNDQAEHRERPQRCVDEPDEDVVAGRRGDDALLGHCPDDDRATDHQRRSQHEHPHHDAQPDPKARHVDGAGRGKPRARAAAM